MNIIFDMRLCSFAERPATSESVAKYNGADAQGPPARGKLPASG